LTITTNAPPMNELVMPDRGILCPYVRAAQKNFNHQPWLTMNYYVSERTLKESVVKAISLSPEEKLAMRNNARTYFEDNDKTFKDKFVQTIKGIVG